MIKQQKKEKYEWIVDCRQGKGLHSGALWYKERKIHHRADLTVLEQTVSEVTCTYF
jgi:hypothetical protein